jgi:hypothetical protein
VHPVNTVPCTLAGNENAWEATEVGAAGIGIWSSTFTTLADPAVVPLMNTDIADVPGETYWGFRAAPAVETPARGLGTRADTDTVLLLLDVVPGDAGPGMAPLPVIGALMPLEPVPPPQPAARSIPVSATPVEIRRIIRSLSYEVKPSI